MCHLPTSTTSFSNQRSFTEIGAYRTRSVELSGAGEPEQITVAQLTSSVFGILGVNPLSGRMLLSSDSRDEHVAVISHGLWQRRFGARSVLGERLILDRQPYEIVGVMPAAFEFPKRGPALNGEPPSVAVTWVHGNYFGTFGIPILRGRTFAPEEETENRAVAIVSRALASRFWPGEDAVGKRVKWGLGPSNAPWMTVVDVASDVVDGALGSDPIIHLYVPYSEIPDGAFAAPTAGLLRRLTAAVHSQADAARLTIAARVAVASLDPALAVTDVATMQQVAVNCQQRTEQATPRSAFRSLFPVPGSVLSSSFLVLRSSIAPRVVKSAACCVQANVTCV